MADSPKLLLRQRTRIERRHTAEKSLAPVIRGKLIMSNNPSEHKSQHVQEPEVNGNSSIQGVLKWIDIQSRLSDWDGPYGIDWGELEFAMGYVLTMPKNPIFLELGTCHGRTLAALAIIAEDKEGIAVGVDDFRLMGCALEVRTLLDAHKIDYYILHTSNTHDLPWHYPIDTLIIDGGHDEYNVSEDIKKYVPFVKPGGIVFIHDYDEPFIPTSAHWAVRFYIDKVCANDENWIDLGQSHGLKGWRRREVENG